jgi:hypothetical protein
MQSLADASGYHMETMTILTTNPIFVAQCPSDQCRKSQNKVASELRIASRIEITSLAAWLADSESLVM